MVSEVWVVFLCMVLIVIIEVMFMVYGVKWCEFVIMVVNVRGEGKLIFVFTSSSVKGEICVVVKDWLVIIVGCMCGFECFVCLVVVFGVYECLSLVVCME